jgi:hypothetical protein
MDLHPFDPYPTVPGVCQECDMPESNRSQHPTTGAVLRPLQNTIRPIRFDGRRTSTLAALKAAPKSSTVKGQVLAIIAAAPRDHGVTDAELGHKLMRVKQNTLRPRRIDLVEEGWVEPVPTADGKELTRGGFTCWRLSDIAVLTRREAS